MASRKVLKVMQQARQGEAAACLLLGQCYLRGEEGLGSNFQAAWRWLSLAAEKGLDEALPLIAEYMPEDGLDPLAAYVPLLEQADARGAQRAAVLLARWRLGGRLALPPGSSFALCRAQLVQAAMQGERLARLTLGQLAADGVGPPDDLRWLVQAAACGESAAMRRLLEYDWLRGRGELWQAGQVPGQAEIVRSDDEQAALQRALQMHQQVCVDTVQQRMSPGELRRRGCLLLHAGQPIGRRWLERAALAGDARAAYLLGLLFMGPGYLDRLLSPGAGAGLMLRPRYKQAELWLNRALAGDNAEAGLALYLLNRCRNYSSRSRQRGQAALLQAAHLGHPEACWQAALSDFEAGAGESGLNWLQRAAELGHTQASRCLIKLPSQKSLHATHLANSFRSGRERAFGAC